MIGHRALLAATAAAVLAIPAAGQRAQAQGAQSSDLPEICRTAAQAGGQGQGAQGSGMMQDGGTAQETPGMMAGMSEAQKAFRAAMMKMTPAMMTGMMAGDADVAWACSMIPHHQGAIDMARSLLKTGGDNAAAKRLAEKTISEQEKDIADLKGWLEKQGKAEGND